MSHSRFQNALLALFRGRRDRRAPRKATPILDGLEGRRLLNATRVASPQAEVRTNDDHGRHARPHDDAGGARRGTVAPMRHGRGQDDPANHDANDDRNATGARGRRRDDPANHDANDDRGGRRRRGAENVTANGRQARRHRRRDDPANHDANDDRNNPPPPGNDDPAGHDANDDRNNPAAAAVAAAATPAPSDDPASHDANDDRQGRGQDDPAGHDANDDRGGDDSGRDDGGHGRGRGRGRDD